jgi:Ankyrin repeats (3 copies)
MSEMPPSQDLPDDVDDSYRRAAALDSSRPSEWVRHSVLAHAKELATDHASSGNRRAKWHSMFRGTRRAWLGPTVFGTLAAAAFAGLLIAPRFLAPPVGPVAAVKFSGAPASPATSGAPTPAPFAPAPETPAAREPAPAASAPENSAAPTAARPALAPEAAAARAPAPSASDALAARMAAGSAPAPAAPPSSPSATPATSLALAAPARPRAHEALEAPAVFANAGGSAAQSGSSVPAEARRKSSESTVVVEAHRESRVDTSRAAASPISVGPAVNSIMSVPSPLEPPAALRPAAENGDMPALKALLAGAGEIDVDSRDAEGHTALMLATLHGQTEAVKLLLAHGADPNAADSHGTTPLQAAVAGSQTAIVKALKRAGAH